MIGKCSRWKNWNICSIMLVWCKANVDGGWTWERSSSGSYVYASFKPTTGTPDRTFDDLVEFVMDVSDPLKVKEFTYGSSFWLEFLNWKIYWRKIFCRLIAIQVEKSWNGWKCYSFLPPSFIFIFSTISFVDWNYFMYYFPRSTK